MTRIHVLNGPNLNLLGRREPAIYGHDSLADIEARLVTWGDARGVRMDFRQSNHEGVLIDWLHEAAEEADGVILNPGGLTHGSVALLDAIQAIPIPVVEVHLSNIHAREDFRARSLTARAAAGIIAGFGALGYELAAEALLRLLRDDTDR
ncbi:MAG: type II 3-dehydroquinate dehydratase [Alphaproteobacteria bacterium]|nr:MAG: type II 3-dehydroquinate dehydratase [Alphaproteobacteria bacterium]